ncbi:NAD-dependent epimerase/dehydratase family protein [Marinobacter nauticus]|uniref:NAD-dependent epimerase/dehydratase family protein n=1 Tax=Marinobacter nauticus TaxID=2743 RepID=UPI001C99329B|nr:NAD-dependent epimerase/dehydratase family protein [Marinobacter nauticus]MBY5937630.1 NAD-dependent epimerase/dehydratase family protein [Marinobacter nauticus]MBY5954858.1 NAD-dependent epimerase/dehydratase family protein [Marinobacter nauticus]MBY6008651.1 NAD-dependent epimerase/dehydratase family protein [Marinobacter nauticus]
MKVVLTGASGFVGRALGNALSATSKITAVTGLVRAPVTGVGFDTRVINDLSDKKGLQDSFRGADVVVHLAARAHVLGDESQEPLSEFRRVNVEGTLNVAKAALESGVSRLVFLSSIGVNGNKTEGNPFSEKSIPDPVSDYALSKWEAEESLRNLCAGSLMELVIVRPPLVYAGQAPGNFGRLLKLVSAGIPLPFGAVSNFRSMVALDNLVDFLQSCILHPEASNETFLISDGEDLSLAQIIGCLAEGMAKRVILVPVPVAILSLGANILGKGAIIEQLCGSLQVDAGKARRVLGWTPVLDARQALKDAGKHYSLLKSAGDDA